jgi:hypothetical protein
MLGVARPGNRHDLHTLHRTAPAGGIGHQPALAHDEAATHDGVQQIALHGVIV